MRKKLLDRTHSFNAELGNKNEKKSLVWNLSESDHMEYEFNGTI
jgi:hypothetical protein